MQYPEPTVYTRGRAYKACHFTILYNIIYTVVQINSMCLSVTKLYGNNAYALQNKQRENITNAISGHEKWFGGL